MKRFALYPGYVISPNDGDLHYISAPDLARLHGVRLQECVIVDPDHPHASYGHDLNQLLPLRVSDQGAGYWKVSNSERSQYPVASVQTLEGL